MRLNLWAGSIFPDPSTLSTTWLVNPSHSIVKRSPKTFGSLQCSTVQWLIWKFVMLLVWSWKDCWREIRWYYEQYWLWHREEQHSTACNLLYVSNLQFHWPLKWYILSQWYCIVQYYLGDGDKYLSLLGHPWMKGFYRTVHMSVIRSQSLKIMNSSFKINRTFLKQAGIGLKILEHTWMDLNRHIYTGMGWNWLEWAGIDWNKLE